MKLVPYLIFNGNCEEAMKFYGKVLGGSMGETSKYGDMPPGQNQMGMDPDKIMHTQFLVDGNPIFMASDGPSNASDSGMVSLSLDFNDTGKIESAFASMSDGGQVSMPLQKTFWAERFGMLTDQYGIKWMFNQDEKK